jgi:hypothetical protein
MIHNVKTLGVTLVAAFSLSAMAATAASAESFAFYGGNSLTLEGTNDSSEANFIFVSGEVSCPNATYAGTLSGEEASFVELTPSYTGCEAFGLPATFKANGCAYRFTAGTFESGEASGSMDIVCPEGKELKIEALSGGKTVCTVDVPAQTNLSGTSYTNVSSTTHKITVATNTEEKLKYTITGSFFCGSGTHEDGGYSGNALVTTQGAGESTGLAVAKPKPLFVLDPAKVDFEKGGDGKVKEIKIENKSQEKPTIDMTIVANGFKEEKNCGGMTLKEEGNPGDKCTEKIECKKAGASGDYLVLATASYAVYKAELENC